MVDTGDTSFLYYSLISTNEVRFVLTLDESRGNYTVGNIMLYLSDGTPFLAATMSLTEQKIKENLPSETGNTLDFVISLVYSNVQSAIDVTILTPTYAELPQVSTEVALLPAGSAPQPNYWVQNVLNSGRPTIVGRATSSQTWYGGELYGVPSSADFGCVIDGGLLNYSFSDAITILGGGYYSPYLNTLTIDGGTYTSSPSGSPIDFGTYTQIM